MKLRACFGFIVTILLSASAFAWNCSDPLASRVAVGTTQPAGTAGDGDGQWFLGVPGQGTPGVYYVCEVPKSTPPTTTNPTSTSTSTSSSTSGASANSGSSSNSGASATGGNSSATGGTSSSTSNGGSSTSKSGVSNSGNSTATGGAGGTGIGTGGSVSGSGNSTVGPISTSSTATGGKVANSGNSSNTNNNTAAGGSANGNGSGNTTTQGQQQQQSNSSSNNSSASNQSNGNGSNSNNTTNNSVVEAPKIPVPTAYAPTTIPTSPCLKGYEAGGQGAAFGFAVGGSKVDKNCQLLEVARSFDSMNERLAGCKVKISSPVSKKAGVTLEDCMQHEMVDAPIIAPPPAPAPPPQPTIIVVPQAAAPVQPVVAIPAAPVLVEKLPLGVCTFASKTACTAKGSDAAVIDPSRPTSVCKIMIDAAVREFRAHPGYVILLTGNKNVSEDNTLPVSRTTRVKQQLEAAGIPSGRIVTEVGTGDTRTVSIDLVPNN